MSIKAFVMKGKVLEIAELLFPKKEEDKPELKQKVKQQSEGGVYLCCMDGKEFIGETRDAFLIIKGPKKKDDDFTLTLTTGNISNINICIIENFKMEDVEKINSDLKRIVIKNSKYVNGVLKITRK